VSEGSSQPATGKVTLCTSGSGTLTWKASWNQTQAPWLQLAQSNGSVQAPNQIPVTISASAANLAAGTYTVTITFIGEESNTTQAVKVTFTVQVGCVNATPPRLSFVGVEGISDPNPQTITVTNCGLTNNWSAKIDKGSSWLAINPSQGTLQGGATGTITVKASNVEAKLAATSYPDSITITIGTHTTTVSVLLTVQPAISINPTSMSAYTSPCTGSSSCVVTLINNSNVALTWSASSNVTVRPSNGFTIPAGSSETVTIVFSICTNTTVTFTVSGTTPASMASVVWGCTPIT